MSLYCISLYHTEATLSLQSMKTYLLTPWICSQTCQLEAQGSPNLWPKRPLCDKGLFVLSDDESTKHLPIKVLPLAYMFDLRDQIGPGFFSLDAFAKKKTLGATTEYPSTTVFLKWHPSKKQAYLFIFKLVDRYSEV